MPVQIWPVQMLDRGKVRPDYSLCNADLIVHCSLDLSWLYGGCKQRKDMKNGCSESDQQLIWKVALTEIISTVFTQLSSRVSKRCTSFLMQTLTLLFIWWKGCHQVNGWFNILADLKGFFFLFLSLPNLTNTGSLSACLSCKPGGSNRLNSYCFCHWDITLIAVWKKEENTQQWKWISVGLVAYL